MENKTENNALIELTKVFNNSVENYDDNLNVGLRPMKAVVPWLLLYLLTDSKSKEDVLNKVAKKTATPKEYIANLVNQLITVKDIKWMIMDYQMANGSFVLKVPSHLLETYLKKAKELDDLGFLASCIESSGSQSIVISMKSQIKFEWAAKNASEKAKCSLSTKPFKGTEIDFLKADDNTHAIRYDLVNFEKNNYHVVAFNALQNRRLATVYFMQNLEPSGRQQLKSQYYEIINEASRSSSSFSKEQYDTLKELTKAYPWSGLNLTEKIIKVKTYDHKDSLTPQYSSNFIFNFPKLKSTLSTTENRLGIYSFFEDADVAGQPVLSMSYNGVRELFYDEKGGEIRNIEHMECKPTTAFIGRRPTFKLSS